MCQTSFSIFHFHFTYQIPNRLYTNNRNINHPKFNRLFLESTNFPNFIKFQLQLPDKLWWKRTSAKWQKWQVKLRVSINSLGHITKSTLLISTEWIWKYSKKITKSSIAKVNFNYTSIQLHLWQFLHRHTLAVNCKLNKLMYKQETVQHEQEVSTHEVCHHKMTAAETYCHGFFQQNVITFLCQCHCRLLHANNMIKKFIAPNKDNTGQQWL